LTDDRHIAGQMDTNEIGSQIGCKRPAIHEPRCPSGICGHEPDRIRQAYIRHAAWQMKSRHQKARRNIIGRQYVEHICAGERLGRDIAGM
jgi:hypothetical protein